MLHYVKFSYCAYVIITELEIIVVQKQQIKMKAITKTSNDQPCVRMKVNKARNKW